MTRIATLSGPRGQIATFSSNAQGDFPLLDLVDIKGWHGGVGVKNNTSPRLGHGMFDDPTKFTNRLLTIYAMVKYETLEQRTILERGFSSMLADAARYTLRVDIEGVALSCRVQQDGEIAITNENFDTINVQIPLRTTDAQLFADERSFQLFPAGYGEGLVYPLAADGVYDYGDVQVGSSVPMRNGGTATAYPRFRVHGNWPSGFRITAGQRVVEYGAAVLGTQPVEIDMRTGSITIDGDDRTHLATRRQWFGVEPGATIQPRLAAVGEGTGWADAFLADTYL